MPRPLAPRDECWSNASCVILRDRFDSAEVDSQYEHYRQIQRQEHGKYLTGWALQKLLTLALEPTLYNRAQDALSRSYTQHVMIFSMVRRGVPKEKYVNDLVCGELIEWVLQMFEEYEEAWKSRECARKRSIEKKREFRQMQRNGCKHDPFKLSIPNSIPCRIVYS
jgi:hypothetical protein